MNSTILKNPQIGRVTGRCYSYFNKFCDWWTSLSTHLKYDWLIMMKLSDYSQLSDYFFHSKASSLFFSEHPTIKLKTKRSFHILIQIRASPWLSISLSNPVL